MRAAALALILLAGCGEDRCRREAPGTLCALAGTGALGFNGDGKAPEETELNLPSAVRRGPDGRIYVMDFNNYRLRRIEEGVVRSAAGNGVHGLADTEVDALDSPLENPIDFAFDPEGRLLIVSYHDPRVLRLERGRLRALAGTGTVGDSGDGGPALAAELDQLDGIAVRADGAIYVSDSRANRVRLIEGGTIRTVAGTGAPGYSGDGGPGPEGALSWPTALALDARGNLYIADKNNAALRRLAPDGTLSTVTGTGTPGASGDGGPATAAQLHWPDGVAVAEDGTLYVSDSANHRIRRIDTGGRIDTIAGTGAKGTAGLGGDALEAELGYTSRIALDGRSLLIADQSNGCARRLFLP